MRPYEVAVILDASLDDTIIRQTTDGIVDFVKSKGGTAGRIDRWGRRAFAYEMKKRTEGYYLFVDVTGEPELLSELDRMLTLSDDVLRHRVIRLPEGDFKRREVRSPRDAAPVVEPQAAPVEVANDPASSESSDGSGEDGSGEVVSGIEPEVAPVATA